MSARRTPAEIGALRDRLEAEARGLRQALERARRVTGDARERAGEKAPCAFLDATGEAVMEADPDLRTVDRRAVELARVEEALRRLAADPQGFGRCTRCGTPIDPERLALVPAAELCRGCAE